MAEHIQEMLDAAAPDESGRMGGNPTPKALLDRLTARISVHHQQPGSNPDSEEISFSTVMPNGDQAYKRRVRLPAGADQPLDTGWVENPGYVLVRNDTNTGHGRNPTEEEKAQLEATYVVISFGGMPAIRVAPGRACLFELAGLGAPVTIRCAENTATIGLFVAPR